MKLRSFTFVFTILLTISSNLFAGGAGVCPVFDDGTMLLGLEKRKNGHVWGDFGGKQLLTPLMRGKRIN